jgi:hypothetical protein
MNGYLICKFGRKGTKYVTDLQINFSDYFSYICSVFN